MGAPPGVACGVYEDHDQSTVNPSITNAATVTTFRLGVGWSPGRGNEELATTSREGGSVRVPAATRLGLVCALRGTAL